MDGKCQKNSIEIAGRILEKDEKCRKNSKEEKEKKRKFYKMLRRIGFIIIVIQKEFRTSINRRTILLKRERLEDRFQVRFQIRTSDFLLLKP